MLPSYLLSLREGLEAALIIGIVLGVLRKIHREDLNSVVWGGILSAMAVSVVSALVLYYLGSSFEGKAEEIFEGITMILAAGVLTWMIFWMHRQSANIKGALETDVRRAVFHANTNALFLIAFLAVVREGVELSLFLTAASFASSATQTIIGSLLGLLTAIVLGWLLFATTIRLNIRGFFQITSILLIMFAAGLVAHGVHEFNEAGLIPGVIEPLWDINHILNDQSTVGEVLKALFGYNGNPSLTEVLAYLAYFVVIFSGLRWINAALPVQQRA